MTGERFHPENLGEIRQEHMHRYAWSLDLVAGKDVVDLASGEGFGSALLAGRARSVTGVDKDAAAIAHAGQRYRRDNLAFVLGDAARPPLGDACADVVVSFETIEHVADPAGTMAEIRRLLRPDGFLIMSSPNVEIYTNRQSHHNPFHVKELTRNEFTGLLSSHFPAFRIYGQRLAVASAILGNDIAAQPAAQLLRDRGTIGAGSEELPASMYFIAIAAVLSQNLPLAPASLLLSDAYDVYWATRDRLAAQEIENERLRDRLEPLQRELAALRDRHLPETAIDSGLFDESHYRAVAQQPDLALPELVRHYFAIGEKQGLSPSDKFDSVFYGTEYPDVARTDIGLFRHYLLYGRDEGRWPHRR